MATTNECLETDNSTPGNLEEIDEEFGIPKLMLDSGVEVYGARLVASSTAQEDPLTHLKKIRAFKVREDDILILAYPKCGTHWTWEIVQMLVNKTTDYETRTKEHVMIEFADLLYLDAEPSPRIMNSHLWMNHLPPEIETKKCKIIHLVRNPKDTLVSYFHHVAQYAGDKFTFDLLMRLTIANRFRLSHQFDYLRHISELEKNHPDHPIKHVYYEELKKNPVKSVKEIAEFLEIPASDSFCADIATACGFENLKIVDESREMPDNVKNALKKKQNMKGPRLQLFRKGIVGDWKNHFTVAQNEIFDVFIKKEMEKGLDFKFIYQ